MQQRLDLIEAELERLAERLRQMETRLSRLEPKAAPAEPTALEAEPAVGAPSMQVQPMIAPEAYTVPHVLGLLGRTFLVLCGAFLLRSLTDASIVPLPVGIVLGFGYALAWLASADRSARAGRRLGAALSGLAATAIAAPLLWEATTRFSLLSAPLSTAALTLFTAAAITVCVRRDLQVLAWFVLPAALATNLAVLITQRNWISATIFVLAVAAVSLWCAYGRGWLGLRWPVALAADLVPLMLVSVALRAEQAGTATIPSTTLVLLAGAGLVLVYYGGFWVWTLVLGRRVGAFEAVQGVAVLLVGFVGVGRFLHSTGVDPTPIGLIATVVGLVSYAVAFGFVDRRTGRDANFFYHTSLALVLCLWGLIMAAASTALVIALCLFGSAAAASGAQFDRVTLRAHSAVYLIAAALASGMPGEVLAAIAGSGEGAPPSLDAPVVLVVVTAVACFAAMSLAGTGLTLPWACRLPTLIVGLVAASAMVTVLMVGAIHGLERLALIHRAALATARTAVLSGTAVAAAAVAARWRWVELGWLVYPLLVATGVKLIVEDLPHGRPATLFVGFACFGLALILAPRILRSHDENPINSRG